MIEPKAHYNTECLKCGKVEKDMVRVGVLVFCNRYAEEEGTIDGKVYTKWLRIWKDQFCTSWRKQWEHH